VRSELDDKKVNHGATKLHSYKHLSHYHFLKTLLDQHEYDTFTSCKCQFIWQFSYWWVEIYL